jgi:hypothetical protein
MARLRIWLIVAVLVLAAWLRGWGSGRTRAAKDARAQIKISTNGAGWKESDINRWVANPAGWRQRSFNEFDFLDDF